MAPTATWWKGTDRRGEPGFGNTVAGVLIDGGSANNVIGGTIAGAGNTIVNNPGGGVVVNGAGLTT